MARAGERAPFPGDQREYMTRFDEIRTRDVVVGDCANGVGSFLGRDPGRNPYSIIHRHGKRRLQGCVVVRNHRGQLQPACVVQGHRDAQNTARVTNHERNLMRGGKLSCHDEIAFILTVRVIHHDDQLAGRHRGNCLLHRVENRLCAVDAQR
uniref:GTP cyclohydrolase/3,4-dihydroxy-2-butanone 4-phosphate synthase bi-functional protein (Ribofalvinbiosynthesis) n=1 Tax=uncultured marine thaumarchaeote KM3_61_F08 TaxID=1456214 RepID=A0A075HDJ0_9ARCH|nr:GTP cyclohydrolase/3,4-dihydroxy-2-butanone 4-phosphate synthase bi-functional protein (ribofalvinbiosynthesis) [uncultured marine thaumarchaeote KM3_61_F08]